MNFIETAIPGVWVIEPSVFTDARGYFMESYKQSEFEKHIAPVSFIQDNESSSTYGVLRGLHAQRGEAAQAKLVRVIEGCVLDVAVDIRPTSATFGQHVAVRLSADNKRQLFIPRGFAHGFLVMSPTATFTYKVDNAYAPDSEFSVSFQDPTLAIQWPIPHQELILSDKDMNAPLLASLTL